MSELKVDKVSPRTGNYVALNTVGSKNIIINGDMSIAQRGTSATGLGNGDSGYHTCDRWRFQESGLHQLMNLHNHKIQMYQLVKVLQIIKNGLYNCSRKLQQLLEIYIRTKI
jgi:hypothetical protein